MPAQKDTSKEPETMAKRFLMFCLAVLAGIVILQIAVQLLSQFWGWLVVLGIVVLVVLLAVSLLRARRDRW